MQSRMFSRLRGVNLCFCATLLSSAVSPGESEVEEKLLDISYINIGKGKETFSSAIVSLDHKNHNSSQQYFNYIFMLRREPHRDMHDHIPLDSKQA